MALRNMKYPTDYNTFEDEIKRFYKTICEIIEKPPDDDCAMKGLIVPITVKIGDNEKLKYGGLTRIIMDKINDPSASNDRENKSVVLFPVVGQERRSREGRIEMKNCV
jgi:hypothetical protein